MKRKEFVNKSLITGAVIGSSMFASASMTEDKRNAQKVVQKTVPDNRTLWGYDSSYGEVRIERSVPGKPHKGKTFMAIQPHSDDIPIYAGGLVAKLLDEGYTGYLCSVTDDGREGPERYMQCRIDNLNIADYYGMKDSFELLMAHHQLDSIGIQDLKGRFTFLFRAFKIDTVISYDPWGHYEENPDHYITALAVDAASWTSSENDYQEHFKAGIGPYYVREKYYYSRAGQMNNLIVDISDYIDNKVEANLLNIGKGPSGNNGIRLKERLLKEGKRLPLLDGDDHTANFNYAKAFNFEDNKQLGEKYGLKYAEGYHYIGQSAQGSGKLSPREEYIQKNVVPI
jgi:LmbE family N-acetylglucosaminyl deacetylase